MYMQFDGLTRTVSGDIEFETGETYLVFLYRNDQGIWQTMMLSHAVFISAHKSNANWLVPVEDVHTFEKVPRPDGKLIEPLYVYQQEGLMAMLKNSLNGNSVWNSKAIRSDYTKQDFSFSGRSKPAHCTFLSSNSPYPHWEDMINTPLRVWDHAGGDNGCSAASTRVQQAITDMNNFYEGLNLDYAGTHNFNTSCSGGSVTGNDFTSYMSSNLGGSRHLMIMYNDPCNEMTLNGCSGVLAYGGMYWYGSTHSEFGETWRDGAYGYVVMNNGVGSCYCNSIYKATLIHEMSHALGIGHISFAYGDANMNPSGPGSITNLDIQCLDFAYEPGQASGGGGGGSGCEDIISLEFQTYEDNEQLVAGQMIELSHIDIEPTAILTLNAPIIEISSDLEIGIGGNLVIENDGCN